MQTGRVLVILLQLNPSTTLSLCGHIRSTVGWLPLPSYLPWLGEGGTCLLLKAARKIALTCSKNPPIESQRWNGMNRYSSSLVFAQNQGKASFAWLQLYLATSHHVHSVVSAGGNRPLGNVPLLIAFCFLGGLSRQGRFLISSAPVNSQASF